MRTSARWCFTAWNDPIGAPNCFRSVTYSTLISSMRRARPTSCAEYPSVPRQNAVDSSARVNGRASVAATRRPSRRLPSTDVSVANSELATRTICASGASITARSTTAAYGASGSPAVTVMAPPAGAASAGATSGPPTSTCSTNGSGNAAYPASSARSTTSSSVRPRPPLASGTSAPSTPISPSATHAAPLRPSAFSQAARTTAGAHSFARRSRTASRNASWSSVNANSIRLLPGQAEDTLGDHVALDLVGARVDRARQRELVALHPRRLELGLVAEQCECRLVDADVEL